MSGSSKQLLAVYLDGETKTGKGAGGAAVAKALKAQGYNVYYDVAGDFYRRYVALVRQYLGLKEEDVLPVGVVLEQAAQAVYEAKTLFQPNTSLGDLQRPSISKSVSILGELELAQKAGREWWAATLHNAVAADADVLVVDGRNPRRRIAEQLEKADYKLQVVLDLFMTCEPYEAARRILLADGISGPTVEQLTDIESTVADRRKRDRIRKETPFLQPDASVTFLPSNVSSEEILSASWLSTANVTVPRTIILDNTAITKPYMLEVVADLALRAVARSTES